MKSLFYLTGILLVLSGCKGNAFLKQRYTHYSHTTTNKETTLRCFESAQHRLAQDDRKYALTANAVNIPDETVIGKAFNPKDLVLATAPMSVSHENKTGTIFNHSSKASAKSNPVKNVKTKFVSQAKSHFKKASESKHAIIGTLLKIVLAVIVLAIVVGIIFLVMLLG